MSGECSDCGALESRLHHSGCGATSAWNDPVGSSRNLCEPRLSTREFIDVLFGFDPPALVAHLPARPLCTTVEALRRDPGHWAYQEER